MSFFLDLFWIGIIFSVEYRYFVLDINNINVFNKYRSEIWVILFKYFYFLKIKLRKIEFLKVIFGNMFISIYEILLRK